MEGFHRVPAADCGLLRLRCAETSQQMGSYRNQDQSPPHCKQQRNHQLGESGEKLSDPFVWSGAWLFWRTNHQCTWSLVRSVVYTPARDTPAPQRPQGFHWQKNLPGTEKIRADSDGSGCWAEGTRAWSPPVPAQPRPLGVCTDLQRLAYVNICRGDVQKFSQLHNFQTNVIQFKHTFKQFTL